MTKRASELLASLTPPAHERPTFTGGATVALEVPGVEGPEDLKALLTACDDARTPPPHRVIETRGLGGLTRQQVLEMVAAAKDRGVGLVASIGPRASKDLGRYALSPHGQRAACRLRGLTGLTHGLGDALRTLDLGVRGLLVYDEGLLEILSRLRAAGQLPPETRLKASIAMGTSNPVHARVLAGLGADSLNPVNDLSVEMLAELRSALEIPLDVHLDDGPSAGSPDRLWEATQIVAACSPVFLKCGRGGRGEGAEGRAQRLQRVREALAESTPPWLEHGAPEVALPA